MAAKPALRGGVALPKARLPVSRAVAPQAARRVPCSPAFRGFRADPRLPASSCSAAHVGAVRFSGKGSIGSTAFTAPAKAAAVPKFLIFAAIGISIPTLAAIATALATPALTASSPVVAWKLPASVTFLAMCVYYYCVNMVSVVRFRALRGAALCFATVRCAVRRG